MDSAIARIRRFNRAVTQEAGALEQSYLGRGRPLGVARVLCAIAPEGTELAALRAALGLDSGLLSRTLRGLEDEGLVTLAADPDDARRRRAALTPEGRAEVAAYDALSDARAGAILRGLGRDGAAMLDAMDRIAVVLGRARISVARIDPAAPRAAAARGHYYAELSGRFGTVFAPGPDTPAVLDDLRPPRGSFLIAACDGLDIGCVGLRPDGTTPDGAPQGEVKRLWVAGAARGLGLARRLMTAIEDEARLLGMAALRLDTNATLTEALALYRSSGWHDIARYNDNPHAQHWFAKALAP